MCSEYIITISSVINNIRLAIDSNIFNEEKDLFHVFPRVIAPIIVRASDKLSLIQSQYGLIPYWSEDSKLKFQTHNARIETLNLKPSWKKAIKSQHCIVPINEFREAVREGPHANHVISFRSINSQVIYVAGLYDIWKRDNQFIHSFAIVTQKANAFILSKGHERSPIILSEDQFGDWLNVDNRITLEFIAYLEKIKQPEEYLVSEVRPLKTKKVKEKVPATRKVS